MPILNFPPAQDLNYYRNNYPELNNLSDHILIEHFKRFAVEQGRSTCIYDRREYLQKILQDVIDKNNIQALEISPWDRPILSGDNVKYFDTSDADTLREHAARDGRHFKDIPEKIHFVSPNGDLGIINETFGIAFSAHVIEHTPDLIKHLRDVARLLNRGGLYVLIIPDKRYCFDHYHPETTIAEIIDAFVNERKNPRLADVFNHAYTYTHNDAKRHWLGDHGKRYGYRTEPLHSDAGAEILGEFFADDGKNNTREQIDHLVEKYTEAQKQNAYISAHNWRFTPDNFGYIVDMLNKLEFIDLKLYRLCHTLWGRFEFVAVLEKI